MGFVRSVIWLAIVLAPLGGTRVARANAAAPFSTPVGAVPGAVMERASPLRVEREELVVDCAQPGAFACTFTATYFLYNPTNLVEEVLGAFYAMRTTDPHASSWHNNNSSGTDDHVRAELDGQAADAPGTDEQLQRMDEIVVHDPEIGRLTASGRFGLQRDPFLVSVAPGTRARLVFRGPLRPIRFEDPGPKEGYAIPALRVRHVALASKNLPTWDRVELEYLYLLSPLRGWAGDPNVTITVRYPLARDFTPSSPAPWRSETDGEIVTSTTTVRAATADNLRFRLSRNPFPIMHGGPLLGIGPRIGREELRARFGYEIGGPEALVYSVAGETNFRDYVTAVATVEAASPSFVFIIPSLALGIGVPVQFRKDAPTRVGVRGQLAISWPLVSLLFPIDVYVAENSSGAHVEGAFVTQVSF